MSKPDTPSQPERREFLTKAAAVVVGGAVVAVPTIAGLCVAFDPLQKKTGAGGPGIAVRVATLASLPEGGEPRKFPVVIDQVDVWNRTPNVPVGAVYLQRVGPDKVRALNAKCPHTGCFVNYQPGGENRFHCPCHDSTFAVDGKILNPRSPSPRALDELKVEIREGGEIWLTFQNFRPGVHEQIPV
jgi:menaquinol-cytochrome c reductase iron-sulfur subunit